MNSCDCLERGTHEKYQKDGKKNTRDVIPSPEPACSLLVTLANKRCVEEKTSLLWEVKTTQTMIGSSLTKHLSDRQHAHTCTDTQTCKQTLEHALFYATTNEAEREMVFNSLLPFQIGVRGGKARK